MLYTFKTTGWFQVPSNIRNYHLKQKLGRRLEPDEIVLRPSYTNGYISVVSPNTRNYVIIKHYSKNETIFYHEKDLPYVEAVLRKNKIDYTIHDAKTNEQIVVLPANIDRQINIALTEISRLGYEN